MKSDIRNITYTKLVEEKSLVLTFTPEEVKALLPIGGTSDNSRVALLNKCYSINNNPERNKQCSNLLAEIYFAANDFNKEPK